MTLSLFAAAEKHPERTALIAEGRSFSYAALAQRVACVAAELADRGLLKGLSPVGVVARPNLASLELMHALIAFRVPLLLLHPSLPASEQQALLERAGARALLSSEESALASSGRSLHPAAEPEVPALPLAIVPTSGTSGKPKLVVLSRGAFIASALASSGNLPLGERDRWLLCLPPSHVGGFSILTRTLLAGSTLVAFDAGSAGLSRKLPELAQSLVENLVSVISLVPTLLDAWLTSLSTWTPPPSLRAVLVGGAGLSQALLQRARARGVPLLSTYGLTEACSQVTTTRPSGFPNVNGGVVSSGFALPGVELKIEADSRICVRSPTLCSGYVDGDAPIDEHGWFHTQDRGFIDGSGELYVLGRASELIVSAGENVDPLRVEGVLSSAPGVTGAIVFGVPDERYGELVACAVTTHPNFDEAEVSRYLCEHLSRAELPRRLARMPSFVTLPNGKIDRSAVRKESSERLVSFEHPRAHKPQ
ncbi:MAG: AMP-binding protein [Myxococcota bacterium]